MNFVDLCSVSNISVFILDQNLHGYYIHGRSPHGISDVNMKDMIMNLERESRMMSGTRGLEANSTEQLFIMKVNKEFRMQYDLLFRKFSVKKRCFLIILNKIFVFRIISDHAEQKKMQNVIQIFYFNHIKI